MDKLLRIWLIVAAAVFIAAINVEARRTGEKAMKSLRSLSAKELKYKTWVVLAAGSKGYSNYRHQADLCHAYHVIHDMGVPEDHIIVMMADDVAYDPKNPFPGTLYNEDTLTKNVYEGVPHDYTGYDVTAENFIQILKGETMTVGTGKTLKSGPNDNVFVFYDDHGGYDELCFPDDSSVNSSQVQDFIDTMVSKKMFKNLIIYIEACFSGSLFYKLNIPSNVYVVTAAPVGASSYAGCFNSQLNAFACDFMAHAWITDMETPHSEDRTFEDQYEVIDKTLTQSSQGCRYGDMSLQKLTLDDYFYPSFSSRNVKASKISSSKASDIVSNFDVELEVARRVYESNRTKENFNQLNKQILIRKKIDEMGAAIVTAALPKSLHLASVPCKVCDDTCHCIISCKDEYSEERCKFECCNEESCHEDPPEEVNSAEFERRESCMLTLSKAYRESCGKNNNNHPYLLTTGLLFRRICKQPTANIANALEEINRQCSSFDLSAF